MGRIRYKILESKGESSTSEPGLRDRKRQRARAEIEAAATALFEERGVDGVPMREIAERALVSEATLYNYYANKAALVDVWARGRLARAAARAAAQTAKRPARGLGRAIADAVVEVAGADRAQLESAWGRAPRGGEAAAGPSAPAELVELFRGAQASGEVRADVAPAELAELLWSAVEARVRRWLRGDPAATGAEALTAPLRRTVEVVLDGCRKRHERVRAAAATRPLPPPG
ncbi:MAG: TetR/AcrR family transcriptional regulator [Myxococcota bacterium]